MDAPAEPKPNISFEDLQKVDIRVGTILTVDDVPESRKLVKLTVDLHGVSGIKQERDNPTELEGRQALFVVNLDPRKMAGILSEAMLFDSNGPVATAARRP